MTVTDRTPTLAEVARCVDLLTKLVEQTDEMNARSELNLERTELVLAEIRARIDDGALA